MGYAAERFAICKTCPYKGSGKPIPGLTCGPLDLTVLPFTIGKIIIHNNKEIKLCGCYMRGKTKIKKEECPAGKWGALSG